ncbi:Endonuclease MutS2, partial [Dissostichus eleginoides]
RTEGKQGGPDGVSRTAGSIQSCCDMLTSLHQQTAASSTYGGRQTKEKVIEMEEEEEDDAAAL